MPKIDQNIIDRIMDAARIEEVVADFVTLTKKGPRYLGLCPFHDDRSLGSFVVYPAKNCYRCFSCDAKGGVIDFLMNHAHMTYPDAVRYLGQKYSIQTDGVQISVTPPPARPAPAPLPVLVLPMTMVTDTMDTTADVLCSWMRALPWDGCQRHNLEQSLKDYCVGHGHYGHTIFWQIDEQNRVRTGKMMKYRTDGHRDKEASWNFDFIHAALFRSDNFPWYDADRQELKQTLFGMHLLNRYTGAEVHIVESEKTALLMATAYGNTAGRVWMACGGAENLTAERLAPIMEQRRRIVLHPDRDAVERWEQKAARLGYDRLVIDTEAVTKWWKPCDGEKADIADVVVRIMMEQVLRGPQVLEEMIRKNPLLQTLIDKLNLKPV